MMELNKAVTIMRYTYMGKGENAAVFGVVNWRKHGR